MVNKPVSTAQLWKKVQWFLKRCFSKTRSNTGVSTSQMMGGRPPSGFSTGSNTFENFPCNNPSTVIAVARDEESAVSASSPSLSSARMRMEQTSLRGKSDRVCRLLMLPILCSNLMFCKLRQPRLLWILLLRTSSGTLAKMTTLVFCGTYSSKPTRISSISAGQPIMTNTGLVVFSILDWQPTIVPVAWEEFPRKLSVSWRLNAGVQEEPRLRSLTVLCLMSESDCAMISNLSVWPRTVSSGGDSSACCCGRRTPITRPPPTCLMTSP
mmetsp:Transcript_93449/g.267936  ORF Transcript_93449/g.267936 Transcript_93449/m.267936 type:complete len:268 (+) Transcript_93449:616-1419(+)